MAILIRSTLTLLIALLVFISDAGAQAFQRRHAKSEERPPNALLVMLPTATRKVEALQRINDVTRLQTLQYDLAEIHKRTIADFKDNFSFCPVYFFYDTLSSKIKRGDFAGNLLDTALNPVEAAQYGALDGDHIIAFFGYRTRELGARYKKDGMEYFDMLDGDTDAMIQQLVLLDSKMEQLIRPLPRTVANRYPGIRTREKRPRYTYRHYAKHFDMMYRPSAGRADAVLSNFYGTSGAKSSAHVVTPSPGDSTPK